MSTHVNNSTSTASNYQINDSKIVLDQLRQIIPNFDNRRFENLTHEEKNTVVYMSIRAGSRKEISKKGRNAQCLNYRCIHCGRQSSTHNPIKITDKYGLPCPTIKQQICPGIKNEFGIMNKRLYEYWYNGFEQYQTHVRDKFNNNNNDYQQQQYYDDHQYEKLIQQLQQFKLENQQLTQKCGLLEKENQRYSSLETQYNQILSKYNQMEIENEKMSNIIREKSNDTHMSKVDHDCTQSYFYKNLSSRIAYHQQIENDYNTFRKQHDCTNSQSYKDMLRRYEESIQHQEAMESKIKRLQYTLKQEQNLEKVNRQQIEKQLERACEEIGKLNAEIKVSQTRLLEQESEIQHHKAIYEDEHDKIDSKFSTSNHSKNNVSCDSDLDTYQLNILGYKYNYNKKEIDSNLTAYDIAYKPKVPVGSDILNYMSPQLARGFESMGAPKTTSVK